MIDLKLKDYIEKNIIPIYDSLDDAHQSNHVYSVINKSLEIASDFNLNNNMVYVIAAFHDIGLIVNREMHHIEGGKMLSNDSFINDFFNQDQIIIMKEAIEDHRASRKTPPRSLYGKVIAEADRSDDKEEVILRSIQYDISIYGITTFEESFNRFYNHINEKYGDGGYLNVWLDTKSVNDMLKALRNEIKDKEAFKLKTYEIYMKLIED